jgi:hypothetical protein
LRAAQVTGARQHKAGKGLCIAAARRKVQGPVRTCPSFLDIAVGRFAQRSNSLPDGRGLGKLGILRCFQGTARKFARLLHMARIGFGIGLQGEQGIFPAWLADRPIHLALHAVGVPL